LSRRAASFAACALLAACSASAGVPSARPTIKVAGAQVSAAGVSTVAQALKEAGVAVPAGELLSIKTHRPLGPDRHPGRVLVDGLPTLIAAPVRPGAVITVEGGGDVTEGAETVTLLVPANHGIASLRRGSRPGRLRVVRGVVSHEVVAKSVLSKPYDGALLSARPVALTFDDGPNPQWTPKILEALAQAGVRATFCLIGRQAQQYPALVKAIVDGGHTLCNHTWDHDERLNHRTEAQILKEMSKAQAAITQASGGVAPKFFRAPGGAWSGQVELLARRLHMTPLKWTVDPRDWARPGPGHIIGVVMARVGPGAIVLLHDGGGNRDQTLAALHYFLVRLPAYKYVFQVPRPV
jgi:peptidoglycan/xylan/chitin deacetylase (PgdA/CDA1 family)